MKKDRIEIRMREVALHIIKTKQTIRETAKEMHMTKSTVFKDLLRLKEENRFLYDAVYSVVIENKNDRARRGGEATRIKYLGGN